ncbi:LysR family transcriptional regulator [Sphingomonas montana]|uniref:LysR family transcriptional regulator n=1 Tax=Sphingomonas montana TaxID=1843236 RepID=UPI0023E42AD2|nr:LysR family transcriptional regulator [Sphingomonas montana]
MHQVRYFLSMVRLLNFTRAADECNVTQPSLTRAIQKLEDELGGALFRRERSRTHLTDLGRLMLPHLERTFEAAEAAKQLAKNVGKAVVAPLVLGVDASLATDTLDTILAELGKGLPGFALTLTTGTSAMLLEAALNGDLDLLIVELPDAAPDRLERWPLFSHGYYMVVRADHPLAMRPPTSLLAARDEAWIDHDGGNCARLRTAAAVLGFEPVVRHRASDPADVKRLVVAGLGSAFMPRPRDDKRLRTIRFPDADVTGEVVLGAVAGRKRGIAADAFVRASRARSWSAASAE